MGNQEAEVRAAVKVTVKDERNIGWKRKRKETEYSDRIWNEKSICENIQKEYKWKIKLSNKQQQKKIEEKIKLRSKFQTKYKMKNQMEK